MVVTGPVTWSAATEQARTARPSTWTVQAPHTPIPHPYLVPVKPRKSRSTHSSGIPAGRSTVRSSPLTLRRTRAMRVWSAGAGQSR